MTEPTPVITVKESGKTAIITANALVIKWVQYRPVRREERRDVHSSSLLIDVYALF